MRLVQSRDSRWLQNTLWARTSHQFLYYLCKLCSKSCQTSLIADSPSGSHKLIWKFLAKTPELGIALCLKMTTSLSTSNINASVNVLTDWLLSVWGLTTKYDNHIRLWSLSFQYSKPGKLPLVHTVFHRLCIRIREMRKVFLVREFISEFPPRPFLSKPKTPFSIKIS